MRRRRRGGKIEERTSEKKKCVCPNGTRDTSPPPPLPPTSAIFDSEILSPKHSSQTNPRNKTHVSSSRQEKWIPISFLQQRCRESDMFPARLSHQPFALQMSKWAMGGKKILKMGPEERRLGYWREGGRERQVKRTEMVFGHFAARSSLRCLRWLRSTSLAVSIFAVATCFLMRSSSAPDITTGGTIVAREDAGESFHKIKENSPFQIF